MNIKPISGLSVEVPISTLKPNPFRNLAQYPLNQEKIESLRESIRKTDLWKNIIGRKNANGEIEIAYGHHRIAAAVAELGKNYMATIHIENLDDDDMLVIMADENADEWGNTLAHKRVSVQSARDRIEAAIAEFESYEDFEKKYTSKQMQLAIPDSTYFKNAQEKDGVNVETVCRFLGWSRKKVDSVWDLLPMTSQQKRLYEATIGKPKPINVGGSMISSRFSKRVDEYNDEIEKAKKALKIAPIWKGEIVDKFQNARVAEVFKDLASDERYEEIFGNTPESLEKAANEFASFESARDLINYANKKIESINAAAAATSTLKKLAGVRDARALVSAIDSVEFHSKKLAESLNYLGSVDERTQYKLVAASAQRNIMEASILKLLQTFDKYGYIDRYRSMSIQEKSAALRLINSH